MVIPWNSVRSALTSGSTTMSLMLSLQRNIETSATVRSRVTSRGLITRPVTGPYMKTWSLRRLTIYRPVDLSLNSWGTHSHASPYKFEKKKSWMPALKYDISASSLLHGWPAPSSPSLLMILRLIFLLPRSAHLRQSQRNQKRNLSMQHNYQDSPPLCTTGFSFTWESWAKGEYLWFWKLGRSFWGYHVDTPCILLFLIYIFAVSESIVS